MSTQTLQDVVSAGYKLILIDYRLRHKGKLRLSKKPVPKPRSTHKETANDYTDVEMKHVEAEEKTEDYFEDSDLMGVYAAKGLIVWYCSMKCCVFLQLVREGRPFL